MTLPQSIILGIIQGLSEFLPISSSGHLVLAPFIFGWQFSQEEAFVFDVLVQVATLVAVIIYFWSDLKEIGQSMLEGLLKQRPLETNTSRLGWLIILATIPAVIIAILYKEDFERAFSNPETTAYFLLVTSFLLLLGEFAGKRNRKSDSINWLDSLIIGLFQVLALLPGISRSGATISGGLIRNLDRNSSARFSFLMAVPVMLAAGTLALVDLFQYPQLIERLPIYFGGFISAGIVGYFAIRWFIAFLSRQSLYIFSGYCAFLGFLMLLLLK